MLFQLQWSDSVDLVAHRHRVNLNALPQPLRFNPDLLSYDVRLKKRMAYSAIFPWNAMFFPRVNPWPTVDCTDDPVAFCWTCHISSWQQNAFSWRQVFVIGEIREWGDPAVRSLVFG